MNDLLFSNRGIKYLVLTFGFVLMVQHSFSRPLSISSKAAIGSSSPFSEEFDDKHINDGIMAIKEIKRNKFMVYLNPTSNGIFYADIPSNKSFQLDIYTINGRLLQSKDEFKSKDRIDVRQLPNGIYMVKLTNPDQVLVSKVIYK